MGLRIFVTLGTDHHPFDRLVGWVDSWAQAHPQHEVLVQHGQTSPPRTAGAQAFFSHPELLDAMRSADLVVCQGGPGSIVDSLAAGRRPVVVPRLARLGEVVDDHQVAFCRHMEVAGRALLAMDRTTLHDHLGGAVEDPSAYLYAPAGEDPAKRTARTMGHILDELVEHRRSHGRARRRVRDRLSLRTS